jgi:hypothetical protein
VFGSKTVVVVRQRGDGFVAASPQSRIVEIVGPKRAPFNEIIAPCPKAAADPRDVTRDPEAR